MLGPTQRSFFITHCIIILLVIASFADAGTEDVFDGSSSRRARSTCPPGLWPVARRKLDQINRVRSLSELRAPPGNRLESLAGNRAGQHSIRINDQYRICFRWKGEHAYEVEITDYH
jgi:toxin HigB-1